MAGLGSGEVARRFGCGHQTARDANLMRFLKPETRNPATLKETSVNQKKLKALCTYES